jgi:hypothetical protein
MEALGPDFTCSTELALRMSPCATGTSGDGCAQGAADYTAATHTIRIDPVCTHGDLELRTALGHELGHFLGLTHVCRSSGGAASVQSRRYRGCGDESAAVATATPRSRRTGRTTAKSRPGHTP